MTAEEMFEELDGVFSVDIDVSSGYCNTKVYKITLNYVDSKKVIYLEEFRETLTSDSPITPDILKCIIQFEKELGWL